MSLLTPLLRRSLENPSTTLSDPDDWLIDTLGGGRTSSGLTVNTRTAMTYAAVWRAVSLIARDVAKVPLLTYERRTGGGRERAIDHPAFRLLRRKPNEAMTAFWFWQSAMAHVQLRGNAYIFIRRDGTGVPEEIILLPPDQTYPVKANGILFYVTRKDGGELVRLSGNDVIHLRGLGYDGLVGYSVIEFAKDSLGLGLAAQRHASVFFKNSGRVAVVLETTGTLDEESRENLRKSWERMYTGVDNAHRTAVLEDGVTAKHLSLTQKDAQWIELRQFEIREVANWFGVPPHKLGDPSKVSYNSLEQENQSYLNEALDGWMGMIEQEVREKLLTRAELDRDTHFCEYLRVALLRADTQARNAAYEIQRRNGIITANEWRSRENMNPVDAPYGDAFLVPLNVGSVDKLFAPSEPTEESSRRVMHAHRRLAEDCVGRMLKRLGVHAIKAAKKPDDFLVWLDTGLEQDHRLVVAEAFGPIFELLNVHTGGRLDRIVTELFADIRADLLSASECQPAELKAAVETRASVWQGQLAVLCVDKILGHPDGLRSCDERNDDDDD